MSYPSWVMGSSMKDFSEVKTKNSSEVALQRWRRACWLVKNPKRRFRHTANLSKRSEVREIQKSNQVSNSVVGAICSFLSLISRLYNSTCLCLYIFCCKQLRVALLVTQAAVGFIKGITYNVPGEVKKTGFEICADELGSIAEGHNLKKLKIHDGVEGIAKKLKTSLSDGISVSEESLDLRREIYGINKFTESPPKGFWLFVWEALQDTTLKILAVCALVSLVVGISTEGWPKGAHDGLGIASSILLVVFVTATSDYEQSLQFKELDKEKKKITVQVTRDGYTQKVSIFDLLSGDIVHLAIGDQVPADGLFVSGYSLVIDESSLTGESEPVNVSAKHPFLLSGTKVQDGSCKMMVTAVGMRTQWGKLMATLSEGSDDETPLQVKLNGVATFIGKIDLFFAFITFAVLVQGLVLEKINQGANWSFTGDDALELLEYFAIAVTVVVVAVPKGLPLAVTVSLAFAMKKMMKSRSQGSSEHYSRMSDLMSVLLEKNDRKLDDMRIRYSLQQEQQTHSQSTIQQHGLQKVEASVSDVPLAFKHMRDRKDLQMVDAAMPILEDPRLTAMFIESHTTKLKMRMVQSHASRARSWQELRGGRGGRGRGRISKETVECYNSHKLGHYRSECPDMQEANLVDEGEHEEDVLLMVQGMRRRGRGRSFRGGRGGRGRGRISKETVECYNCHKLGHYRSECPDMQEANLVDEREHEEDVLLMVQRHANYASFPGKVKGEVVAGAFMVVEEAVDEAVSDKKETVECYNCHKLGHYRSECPDMQEANLVDEGEHEEDVLLMVQRHANQGRGRGRSFRGGRGGRGRGRISKETVECYNCHKLGHYRSECPDMQEANLVDEGEHEEDVLLMVYVEQNGFNNSDAWFLDSAARIICAENDHFSHPLMRLLNTR